MADDTTDEDDETFTVTLSSPYPTDVVKLATDATAKGTINDDDDPVDDCPHDTTTTCEVAVGGSATGTIETDLDEDDFKVDLEAGTRYQMDLEGAPTSRGTLPDPLLETRSPANLPLPIDDDGGVGSNSRVIYTPISSGTHYLRARKASTPTGTYTLSVIVLGANGASETDTDCPATTATTCRVDVGASATGNIESATDYDWFRVDLEAGTEYQIDLEGADNGKGTLQDPYLALIDGSGNTSLGEDDSNGTGNNSRMTFTLSAAGTYYLQAFGSGNTGTYTLSARDVTPVSDNAAPSFSSDATFDAAENQTTVVTVVATDSDTDDDITGYAITGGADMALFEIGATSGELTFKSAPNFEDPQDSGTDNVHEVTVQATSGAGTREKTATQTITVTVTDVDTEAPGKPGTPTVSAGSATSLRVNWSAPSNAGPPITGYDVRHRTSSPEGSWTEKNVPSNAAVIESLSENTSYDVQVRATTAEGTGAWSDAGSGTTDAAPRRLYRRQHHHLRGGRGRLGHGQHQQQH